MVRGIIRSTITTLSLAGALFAAGAQAADLPSKKGEPVAPVAPAFTMFDVAVSIKGMTDYNFRGISQTNRKPAIQGSAELQIYNNLFYVGVAGSNVKLVTDPSAEVDFYAGIRPKLGDVSFDLGVWQYYYPRERQFIFPAGTFWTPKNTDFTEVYGKVSYTYADALTVGANLFYAWDWLGTGASGTYASITAKYSLPFLEGLAVSGEFGHYWLGRTNQAIWSTTPPTNLPDYYYWNAGVSYTYKNLTADLRYHDTNLSKRECFLNTSDPRGILTGSNASKWCGPAVIGTLSFDITASSVGIFAPK
ncbi:TorF family putative porin [Bosea sp. (in: a-proteobacteria)]|uniref:TorF family putative porin n=1 Tax=Bosea sp. (in: a-proteobacteria) TaxID=1871050 RepID=UPI003B3AB15F